MWWLAGVVLVVAVIGTYVTWTVSRVERLHARAQDATAALIVQLDARAEAVLRLADSHTARLGRYADALRAAARGALDSLPAEREAAENDLTQILREMPTGADDEAVTEVRRIGRRMAVARQVQADVVRDALLARRSKIVRLLGLPRRFACPFYFDIEEPH